MKSNLRKFWQLILPCSSTSDSFTTYDVASIITAFTTYFQSVYTMDNFKIPPFINNSQSTIGDVTVSDEGVLTMVLSLDTKKSLGPGTIHNSFLIRFFYLD